MSPLKNPAGPVPPAKKSAAARVLRPFFIVTAGLLAAGVFALGLALGEQIRRSREKKPAETRAAALPPAAAPGATASTPGKIIGPDPEAEPAGSEIFRREAQRLAGSGDLPGAAGKLEQGLAIYPRDQGLQREMSRVLTMRGFEAQAKGELKHAGGFFGEALHYYSENLEAMRGLAFVKYQTREFAASENLLSAIVEKGGDRPEVYGLWGRICYEQNRLPEALDHYRMSLMLLPEQPEVKELVDKIEREIRNEKDFGRMESRHFQIKYEGREAPELAEYVEQLCEDAYLDVGSALGYYPELPITVILYTNEQFADVTRTPAWAGAIYDGKIRIPALGLKDNPGTIRTFVRHEFTHALINEASHGRAPVWLHEGLAQSMEGTSPDQTAVAARVIALGGPAPLPSLEKEFLGMAPSKAELAYLESYLAVKYLESLRGPFIGREILYQLGQGLPISRAIERATGRDYQTIDSGFREWVTVLSNL